MTHTDRSREFVEEYTFIKNNYKDFDLIPEYIDSGVDESDEKPFYVMRRYKNVCSLFSERCISDRLVFCIKLAEGIKKLHEKSIVHRDIKPKNLALGEDNKPILLDYGTVVENRSVIGDEADVGSEYFQAPELINPPKNKVFLAADLIKADVYSFVKTAWIIIRGDYQSVSVISDDELFTNRKIRFRARSSIDQLYLEPAFQMLKKGIGKEPSTRITMDECIAYLRRSLYCIENSNSSQILETEIAEYQNYYYLVDCPSSKQVTDLSKICEFFNKLTYCVYFLSTNGLYVLKKVTLDGVQSSLRVQAFGNNPFPETANEIVFCPSELNVFNKEGDGSWNYIRFRSEGSNVEEKAFFGSKEIIDAIISERVGAF